MIDGNSQIFTIIGKLQNCNLAGVFVLSSKGLLRKGSLIRRHLTVIVDNDHSKLASSFI